MYSPSRGFSHVGVSVTDIDSAMRWYRDVIQMTLLVEPTEVTTYEKEEKNYDPHLATLVRAIFGPKLGKFKFCHMVSAKMVLELSFFNSLNLLQSYVLKRIILSIGKQDILILV